MKFTPKSEAQLIEENLIPEGTYDYEVIQAEERQSKAGNDMIQLTLKIFDQNGKERRVYDYLLEAMQFKLIHFCESAGLTDIYETGQLTSAHCEGRSGKAIVKIEPARNGGQAKNGIQDYVVDEDATPSLPVPHLAPKVDFADDDIPF